MAERFDAIRAANPDLVVNLYGMTPGGPVTLELIAPDGFTAVYHGETAEAAFDQAFPPQETEEERFARTAAEHLAAKPEIQRALTPPPAAEPAPETGSIFD